MLHRLVLTAFLLTLSSPAFAHGTGQHVLGTVVAIDAKHLEVKTQKGTTVEVQINKQTRFKEKDHPKSANLPEVGDRVVIEAVKDEKTLTATEVHFSSMKKAAPPAPALTQQAPNAAPAH
ncbi:MAG TPA: DUF5666 domain-containing protein [Nitrospira sp.]|jgi:Domain of unknown function (DUF5666)|nr:DUF5666 domain-containing protein [Nitrospira sp.]